MIVEAATHQTNRGMQEERKNQRVDGQIGRTNTDAQGSISMKFLLQTRKIAEPADGVIFCSTPALPMCSRSRQPSVSKHRASGVWVHHQHEMNVATPGREESSVVGRFE